MSIRNAPAPDRQCQDCQSHPRDPTLSGHDAEAFINRACEVLRSIYGLTPDNHPDPRLCSDPPPEPLGRIQGLYFPEPLATRQPTVSWYIANVSYYARASAGVFCTALHYLERAKPRFRPVPADPRTAFVGALILAHRFLEDGSYRTETWARITGSSSRMISACIETMFDALEHRLWIGPLPDPDDNTMFSMREGTIFSEEMMGGQRRCSLPSLSVLYGSRSASTSTNNSMSLVRAFGDPQGVPISAASAKYPVAGPSNSTSIPVIKPVQGLPSPPASPSSTSNTPPPPVARIPKKVSAPARRASSMPQALPPPPPEMGLFNFSQWQAAAQFGAVPPSTGPTRTTSLPPAPLPATQRPHAYLPPPLPYITAPQPVRSHNSPVFSVTQWCTPIPELSEDSTSEMEVEPKVETDPPRTPRDSVSRSTSNDPDVFNPNMWAAQATIFPPKTLVPPQTSLATPAPTVRASSPKKIRYPSATLVPPSSCLDPAWNGRRHSIAVTGTRY